MLHGVASWACAWLDDKYTTVMLRINATDHVRRIHYLLDRKPDRLRKIAFTLMPLASLPFLLPGVEDLADFCLRDSSSGIALIQPLNGSPGFNDVTPFVIRNAQSPMDRHSFKNEECMICETRISEHASKPKARALCNFHDRLA